MQDKRLSVVLCHYYLSAAELEAILNLLTGEMHQNVSVVVVSNGEMAYPRQESSRNPLITYLKGSNSLYDYSAYAEGLRHLGKNGRDADVLFINDSFFRKYPYRWAIKKIVRQAMRAASLPVPLAIGLAGNYDFFLSSNPWSGAQRHLCTACFYLNNAGAGLLLELTDSVSGILPDDSDLLGTDELKRRLRQLFGDRFYWYLSLLHFCPTGGVWTPERMEAGDQLALFKKAICFYLEHRLSGEIVNRGGGHIFVNSGKNHSIFRFLFALSRLFAAFRQRFFRGDR